MIESMGISATKTKHNRARTMCTHYKDVIMRAMVSQITGVSIVCWTVCSGADQRKHQSSASLAFVRGIHRWPVNSPHKGPVTRKMFPFDDVIMWQLRCAASISPPLMFWRCQTGIGRWTDIQHWFRLLFFTVGIKTKRHEISLDFVG